jgi:hypothetical protein
MITVQPELQQAAGFGPALDRRGKGRSNRGARLRLVAAVAGLGALVAWGLLSHARIDSSANAQGPTSAREAPRLDGHGKWIGYTSKWRSRPQILRDAGITQGH